MSLEPLDKGENKKSMTSFFVLLVFLFLLGLALAVLYKLYERESPGFSWQTDISHFGIEKELMFNATDAKRGIRSVTVSMTQDKKEINIFDKNFTDTGVIFPTGPKRVDETFPVNLRTAGFRDGVAELMVTVHDFSWWNWRSGNVATFKYPIVLDARPPIVRIIDSPHYIKPGSAGVIVYKVNEAVTRNGVMINGYFHPGFPLPKRGDKVYGAIIGMPYDVTSIKETFATATDEAGNIGKARFGMILRNAKKVRDRITVTDSFLDLKMPEFAQYYPILKGTPLEQYLYVNNEIRKENYATVRAVCSKSLPKQLWKGRFKRMARSSKRAGFADYRTYYYHDRKVDHQVHLGIDLASVRNAEVKASNSGVVAFADFLGIYGNTVILDHGQGVFSLYAHMSQLNVAKGDEVKQDGLLGLTGNTGMAGGDHLHFSILVNGIFVDPLEWWDARWLDLNIQNYL